MCVKAIKQLKQSFHFNQPDAIKISRPSSQKSAESICSVCSEEIEARKQTYAITLNRLEETREIFQGRLQYVINMCNYIERHDWLFADNNPFNLYNKQGNTDKFDVAIDKLYSKLVPLLPGYFRKVDTCKEKYEGILDAWEVLKQDQSFLKHFIKSVDRATSKIFEPDCPFPESEISNIESMRRTVIANN